MLLATMAVALASGRFAFVSIFRDHDPGLSAAFTADPGASLRVALQQAEVDPDFLAHFDITGLARRSLRHEPLDPVPLRTLALQAAAGGRQDDARRLAQLSERVTRRDALTQLILIQEAVDAGDYVGALRHYDIALRTRDETRTTLFPVLSRAIAEPQIRRAAARYVRDGANWMREFIDFAMRDGPDGPARTAEFVLATDANRQPELMDSTAPILLGMLADQGQFTLMRALYARLPGRSPRVPLTAGFDINTIDSEAGPLAWHPTSDGATGAAFDVSGSAGARPAHIFAGSGERGVVLRRLMTLAPGSYRLDESRTLISGGSDARAIWTMRCAANPGGPALWTGPATAAYRVKGAPGPSIPSACGVQTLELEAQGGSDPRGLELVIDHFDLRR